MSQKTKIALAIIVKPTDEEAALLARALSKTAKHVDGIFITQTGLDRHAKIEEVCDLYGATLSTFEWDYNFSHARNFNFKQVPKEYTHIIWMDADDIFRGIENLKKIIEFNPDTDIFTMNYLYWFDEFKNPTVVHLKTQIVKNNGCVEWAGELHEDFKKLRELKNPRFIKTIDRLHLSDQSRFESNTQRNLEIATKTAAANPKDPRNYWNLGNAQKAAMKLKEAIESFDKFLGMSRSDDEKYIVMLRMAEIYLQSRDFEMAMNTVKMAIGTKPEYPDAYHLKGHILFEMKDFMGAKDSYTFGLKQKTPVFDIIVYNPRDYDYYPLKALAKTYFNLNMPTAAYTCLKSCLEIMPGDKETADMCKVLKKESDLFEKIVKAVDKLADVKDLKILKKKLDAMPLDMQSHPAIVKIRNQNFIKQSSSGHDIVFYCGMTGEEWNPKTAKEKGIGGSEEAIINLARGLAKKGWSVTVYNSCGSKEQKYEGVIYRPFWQWNYKDKQDVTVVWRHPKALDYGINSTKVYVDMHDVINPAEFTPERLAKIAKVMVKSKAHRALFMNIPDEQIAIMPNGVDLSLFENPPARDPYYIVNFSSPDRSLSAAMDIFISAKARVAPEIAKRMTFGWFYGWNVFDVSRTTAEERKWAEAIKARFAELKKSGVAIGGDRINHLDVARQNMKAGALLYPSEFYEIDWIGGSKTQIAGAPPITTSFAAQGEKAKFGVTIPASKNIDNWDLDVVCDFSEQDIIKKEMFINALVDYLENAESIEMDKKRKDMAAWARQEFNLDRVVDFWADELRIL